MAALKNSKNVEKLTKCFAKSDGVSISRCLSLVVPSYNFTVFENRRNVFYMLQFSQEKG